MSEEMDLGSREKSPESVELTPALEIEGGRLSEDSEVGQEMEVGEIPSEVEMLEKDPGRSNSQGSFDMQAMMNEIQQMLQKSEERLKENQKQNSGKIVQELQQVEERKLRKE
jgi:hypothetical protein